MGGSCAVNSSSGSFSTQAAKKVAKKHPYFTPPPEDTAVDNTERRRMRRGAGGAVGGREPGRDLGCHGSGALCVALRVGAEPGRLCHPAESSHRDCTGAPCRGH